jgi:polyhydroxyalkanoate synthase
MEKWLADRPHHPGEAAKQWLKELYQENRLVDGSFILSGRQVNLKSITAPVLNVFALDDHIIPPDTSRALGAKIGSKDYTEIPLPGGHVGLFVSSKSQGKLSKSIADWLVARDASSRVEPDAQQGRRCRGSGRHYQVRRHGRLIWLRGCRHP